MPQVSSTGVPLDLCTVDTCSLLDAYVQYVPNLGGNVFFLALFAVFLVAQLGLGIWYRTWGFLVGMFCGLVLELVGYGGRLQLHQDPFSKNNFLLYLVPITLAPAFISGSIYLCLSRIVVVYGEKISRVRPRVYTVLFISCDVFSLVLQSIGGGIASVSSDQTTANMGIHIMAGGLAFQVASLILFSVLCVEFAVRVQRRSSELEPKNAALRASRRFRLFLLSLALATTFIVVRSIFRVAELSQGFGGQLANNEITYMILEGTMIVLATIALTAFHPGPCFQGQWGEAYWSLCGGRRKNGTAAEGEAEKNVTPPEYS